MVRVPETSERANAFTALLFFSLSLSRISLKTQKEKKRKETESGSETQ